MKKKLTILGSIASIAALVITLFSMQASSENVSTTGNNSPAISNTRGNININYDVQPQNAGKKYVLRESNGGQARVLKIPDTRAMLDNSQQVCRQVLNGTQIVPLDETATQFGYEAWRKVELVDGECAGKIGWAFITDISYE